MRNVTVIRNIFQLIKEQIPFPEMLKTLYGEEPQRGKLLCPFHNEKTPSFHVYEDGFKCFGCGEAGDGVAFVSKLEGLSAIEAASLIAQRFDLQVNHPPDRRQRNKINRMVQERKAVAAFRSWELITFHKLIKLKNYIQEKFSKEGLNINQEMAHKLPLVEWWLEVLAVGSDAEKLELYLELEG